MLTVFFLQHIGYYHELEIKCIATKAETRSSLSIFSEMWAIALTLLSLFQSPETQKYVLKISENRRI